jgi:hypothetical protein
MLVWTNDDNWFNCVSKNVHLPSNLLLSTTTLNRLGSNWQYPKVLAPSKPQGLSIDELLDKPSRWHCSWLQCVELTREATYQPPPHTWCLMKKLQLHLRVSEAQATILDSQYWDEVSASILQHQCWPVPRTLTYLYLGSDPAECSTCNPQGIASVYIQANSCSFLGGKGDWSLSLKEGEVSTRLYHS